MFSTTYTPKKKKRPTGLKKGFTLGVEIVLQKQHHYGNMIITIQETRWEMKLKNWVSKTLVAIMGAMIILVHAENTGVQIAALVITAASAYIYAKYSKYVDRR